MIKKLSIIIPTHSGSSALGRALESILAQKKHNINIEVVVVIDGMDPATTKLLIPYTNRFHDASINMVTKQLKKNQGRFMARMIGAEISSSPHLLFLDDKTRLEPDFLKILKYFTDDVLIGDVAEAPELERNLIEQALQFIRKMVYGKSWGRAFRDYYLTIENFETSPKGTASLIVPRTVFLKACRDFARQSTVDLKKTSDDTRLLRSIVNDGHKILRTSKLKILYEPRSNLKDSWLHLYRRGALFVDYYHRPGTRFFPLLLMLYFFLGFVLILGIMFPKMLLIGLLATTAGLLIWASSVKQRYGSLLLLIIGLQLITATFAIAVVTASIGRLFGKFKN